MVTTRKTSKVMSALKNRGNLSGAKKGVNLLSIVKKLSAKRKAQPEVGESKKAQAFEAKGLVK